MKTFYRAETIGHYTFYTQFYRLYRKPFYNDISHIVLASFNPESEMNLTFHQAD